MNRRKFSMLLFWLVPAAGAVLAKEKQGKGKKKGHKDDYGEVNGSAGYFHRGDYDLVERYYSGPRDLPPGLRKKYYRTGTLPPGWQKKMHPFPPELVRQLPPVPADCELGYIDGVAVIYNRTTRVILDSIDLISALSGH